MTVFFSKKCELGLQAVLYLSTLPRGEFADAGSIAERLNVPREFVSKVLQELKKNGITASKKGKSGGFYLNKNPNEIRLIHIVEAIDGTEMFTKCVLGFKGCSVEEPCPVHEKWGKLRNQAYVMLSENTLADIKKETIDKINSLI